MSALFLYMRRREFMAALGGAAVVGPRRAEAQDGRVRLIGWLDGNDESTESQPLTAVMRNELANRGWIEGRNLKIERRVGAGDANRLQVLAVELVRLAPDAIIAGGAAPTRALQRATQTIPIIFTQGGDATASDIVKNIARPEGNATGFSSGEPTIGGKWLELLKEAAPSVARVAIVFNPDIAPTAPKYIAAIEIAAHALSVQTVKVPFRQAIELVRSIDSFATELNGGLIMLPPPLIPDRVTVLNLAAQHRLPAIYPNRAHAAEGGLMSYSFDAADQHRRTASYVDRILRGAKVTELPVQFPTRYKLVVNMRTAKAIGITMPESFLLNADEIIE
ncbi:MAG: ABC transporter substrate-binding protein [Xanthobacteraceae bacterium]